MSRSKLTQTVHSLRKQLKGIFIKVLPLVKSFIQRDRNHRNGVGETILKA